MFGNIFNRIKMLGKGNNKEKDTNKDEATKRLHLVLLQDRADVSADFLDMMTKEIVDVIKKYVDVNEGEIEIELTNKQNSDGTIGAPALYASIPIKSIKNSTRSMVNKDKKSMEKEAEDKKKKVTEAESKKTDSKETKVSKEVTKKNVEKIKAEVKTMKVEEPKKDEESKKDEKQKNSTEKIVNTDKAKATDEKSTKNENNKVKPKAKKGKSNTKAKNK